MRWASVVWTRALLLGLGLSNLDPAFPPLTPSPGGCPHSDRVYQYSIADPSPEAVCKPSPDTGLMTANLGPPSSSFACKVAA